MPCSHPDMGEILFVTLTFKLTNTVFLFLLKEIRGNLPTRSGWICVYNRWYIHKEAAAKNGTPASQSVGFWPHSANYQPVPPSVYSEAQSLYQNRELCKGMNYHPFRMGVLQISVPRLLDKCLIETLSFVLSVWSASLSCWWGGRNPFFNSAMHGKPDLDRMVKCIATQWHSMCPQNCPGYHAYTDQVTG